MCMKMLPLIVCALLCCQVAFAQGNAGWWNSGWRFRTTVTRPAPYQNTLPRPVEVALDLPLLLDNAGIEGEFDPASVRVVGSGADGEAVQVPSVYRADVDPETRQESGYLAWMAEPDETRIGRFDIYFDTKDRGLQPAQYAADRLPPANLLSNPGFESEADGAPADWSVSHAEFASIGSFEHTTGERSLKITAPARQPGEENTERTVVLSQKIDLGDYAGQEMVFECDLLAEHATYGLPVSILIQQFRADGSLIPECAVQPRWLTLELAEGQLVQFNQRGRFNEEAATAEVQVRMRCLLLDADSRQQILGPESAFTVWLDRMVLRPGERWPWPEASNAGFVAGVIPTAPLNRAFHFTRQRRLGFNGGSEATMTTGAGDHGPQAVHWGLERGTLEFWCRPTWDYDDGRERIFFTGYAYLYRLQSRLRKLNAEGGNQLEFSIADSNRKLHTVSGPAELKDRQWHHIAATWNHPRAHLQLFVDGKLIAEEGPGDAPWPSTLQANRPEEYQGQGIHDEDKRSIPMQAFFGGRMAAKVWPEGDACEAILDEARISDVVRYDGNFAPAAEEFANDDSTRALWHFENDFHGVHGGDDRFVRSYAGCELHPQNESVTLEVLDGADIEQRVVVVKAHAPDSLFEQNRGDNNLVDRWSHYEDPPDPRFVEYRTRETECIVTSMDDTLALKVEGDYAPLMRWVTFEPAEGAEGQTTLLPRWRANDNIVPFSVESLSETLAPGASDADRAFAAMQYVLDATAYYDAHYCETLPSGLHRGRVSYVFLKALNVYPYDQCGPLNYTLRKLFLALGISSNNSPGTHHQFQQAYYDGDWRLFDLASRVYWLERDNESVIGLREVGEDPFAKLRQPGNLNSYFPGRGGSGAFGTAEKPHNMDFALRAGEQISIGWQNEGRWFELTGDREPLSLANIPPYFGNGAIVYRPTTGGEAAEMSNVALTEGDASSLTATDGAETASLIYRAASPYIFGDASVSGSYRARQAGDISLSLSFDEGATWSEVWRSPAATGEIAVNLREHVMAYYGWWLKLETAAGAEAAVEDFTVRSIFVNSSLSLPGKLALGDNRITFVGGPATAPVRTKCSWTERHQSDLGISVNALSYYNMDHESHRNLYIVAPGAELPLEVTSHGRPVDAEVTLEGLPEGWAFEPLQQTLRSSGVDPEARAEFVLKAPQGREGQLACFDVVVREGDARRRVPVQVMIADAALAQEAEEADETSGEVEVAELVELSGARGMRFTGEGSLSFDFTAPAAGEYTLWVRGRWEPGTSSSFGVKIDDADSSRVSTSNMIGFGDWVNPARAYTKAFVHYPARAEQWTWYRIVGPELAAGAHRLTLTANAGAFIDAVVMLPQTPAVDRMATNLLANWNYAPWDNPL